MKKRILGLILTALLFVTIFPVTAFAADGGAPVLQTSENGLAMIKRFEGLSKTPYLDGSQWTIGYGMACNPADYPNGITEAEADALLRTGMIDFEESIHRYTDRYDVVLTQNQFDALVSITFNLGASWIHSDYRFWRMLRDGLDSYTDNQIASAIGVWCHVGSTINPGLIQRRIDEICVFLYNDYTGESGNDFRYLIFNSNGGSVDTDVMLYRKAERYAELTTAVRDGYHFTGFYTAPTGGEMVTANDLAEKNQTVYAQWSQTLPAPSTPPTIGLFSDVPAGQWYATYVTDLAEAGIISGFGDGTFRPHSPVTVGQALKLVLLAAGYDAQPSTTAHWAGGYQELALAQAILESADAHDLDAPATRVFVAKLAANALRLPIGAGLSVFTDTDDGHVAALQQAGIVDGSVDASGARLFHPESAITRAEISKIVWKVRERS